MNRILKIIFPYILILFCACVEHNFFIKISPDGNYQVQYSAHGDKLDLKDFDFPLPYGANWSIHSTIEEIEAESYDYTANRFFKRNQKFPDTFFKGDSIYSESLLKHPMIIKHRNWFFEEKYKFIGKFKGRSVNSKYPIIGELIRSIDNPPQKWLHKSLSYLLYETLDRSNIEWNTKPIIENELDHWIKNDLYSVNDSILFEELDYYKNLGLDIIMQPASPGLYVEMDSIFKLLEDELKITLELEGDNFDFELILPGILDSTNADTTYGDTLYWAFNLDDFMNDDYIMMAESSIKHPMRKNIFIIILGILAVLLLINRYRKNHINL